MVAQVVAVVGEIDDDGVVVQATGFELFIKLAYVLVEAAHIGVVRLDDLLHVWLRTRRTGGEPRGGSGINEQRAVTEFDRAARRTLIEEALHQRRFAPVGIELNVHLLVQVLEALRGRVRQVRVVRGEPEHERAACFGFPLQEFPALLKDLIIVWIVNLTAFRKAKGGGHAQVGLAIERGVIACLLHHGGQGLIALLHDDGPGERIAGQPHGAVLLREHAGVHARPAGSADRRGHEGAVEAEALGGKAVHVRRLHRRILIPDGTIGLIIAEDNHEVGLRSGED